MLIYCSVSGAGCYELHTAENSCEEDYSLFGSVGYWACSAVHTLV